MPWYTLWNSAAERDERKKRGELAALGHIKGALEAHDHQVKSLFNICTSMEDAIQKRDAAALGRLYQQFESTLYDLKNREKFIQALDSAALAGTVFRQLKRWRIIK